MIGFTAVYLSKKYGIPLAYTYHTRYEEYLHYIKLYERMTAGREPVRNAARSSREVLVPKYPTALAAQRYTVFVPAAPLKECLVEESGEVIDAIDNDDDENLCEELGHVLLQVVMHAQIAAERGSFTIDNVVQGVSEKKIRGHPHVFGNVKVSSPEESLELWKKIKEQEKSGSAK